MEKRLSFHAERNVGSQNFRQELPARLDRTLRPAMLLRLERVHLDRNLRRRDDIGQEDEPPASELGAIAQIEIFGQRVVLPAAGVGDDDASPDTCGAVEVEEPSGTIASTVLEHEMAVEQNRLDLREQGVILVD